MQNKPGRMVPDRRTGKGGACAEDGGWGETCSSYVDPKLRGWWQASTASQTAWALQGLLAAGDALGEYEEDAIHLGVKFLLSTQRGDGSWHEAYFTGTGFAGHIYLRYHMCPTLLYVGTLSVSTSRSKWQNQEVFMIEDVTHSHYSQLIWILSLLQCSIGYIEAPKL
ncbi:hypothetical protein KP509_1Z160100 [Ceratopteris richardii]|nr:hypothetical protein KP509_1Z160100 [Ceratopteris richardii]